MMTLLHTYYGKYIQCVQATVGFSMMWCMLHPGHLKAYDRHFVLKVQCNITKMNS